MAIPLVLHAALRVASAEELADTVTEVRSGDTFVVVDRERTIEIRLSDIDAPQGSDYYAPASRTLLTAMIQGKPVRVTVAGRASDSQFFGRAFVGELDINLEMVRRGAAYVCWDFAQQTDYLPWETHARERRIGLWSHTWEIDARGACLRRPPVERVASQE